MWILQEQPAVPPPAQLPVATERARKPISQLGGPFPSTAFTPWCGVECLWPWSLSVPTADLLSMNLAQKELNSGL